MRNAQIIWALHTYSGQQVGNKWAAPGRTHFAEEHNDRPLEKDDPVGGNCADPGPCGDTQVVKEPPPENRWTPPPFSRLFAKSDAPKCPRGGARNLDADQKFWTPRGNVHGVFCARVLAPRKDCHFRGVSKWEFLTCEKCRPGSFFRKDRKIFKIV